MGQKQRLSTSHHDIPGDSRSTPLRPPGVGFADTSVMHRNSSGYIPHQSEPPDNYYRAFLDYFGSGSFFNLKTGAKRMETKVIMSILAGTGLVSYIMGIVMNLTNWKSNILFILGATFMVVKICVYCAKSWQEYRLREWQLKEKAKKK